MKTRNFLALTIVAGVGLMACSIAGLPLAADPTAQPVLTQEAAATEIPVSESTLEPTLPAEPQVTTLPAPLYFISSTDSQIWRIEPDGVSQTQITREPFPITGFDISPVDGSLLYVSNNDLIHTDLHGDNRAMLVDGEEVDPNVVDSRLNMEITNPRWSPDGAQIAFGRNGVNLMPVTGGEPQLILPSDPVPTQQENPQPHPQAQFYQPESWSPDGSKLLVRYLLWPEGFNWGFLSMPDGAFVEVTSAEPPGPCCYPNWTTDSKSVYFSNDTIGMVVSGLWRVDAATGIGETLIDGNVDDQHFSLVRDARILNDGKLYYFFAAREGFPEGNNVLQMYRSEPDGLTGQELIHDNDLLIIETLWADDGRGALIAQMPQVMSDWPLRGPLAWMPTTEGDIIHLPADGWHLRWGQV